MPAPGARRLRAGNADHFRGLPCQALREPSRRGGGQEHRETGPPAEQVCESAAVVAVQVRKHHRVDASRVNAEAAQVREQHGAVASGVEQDAASGRFHEAGEAPRRLARQGSAVVVDYVVEDHGEPQRRSAQGAIGRAGVSKLRGDKCAEQQQYERETGRASPCARCQPASECYSTHRCQR
jgi:hypothetical protein